MSQARYARKSDIELPVLPQGSSLDFLFAQQEVQRGGDSFRALVQLFRQVAFADDYVSAWVA
jgi:hypothetical protein